jgi:hypothetical protein
MFKFLIQNLIEIRNVFSNINVNTIDCIQGIYKKAIQVRSFYCSIIFTFIVTTRIELNFSTYYYIVLLTRNEILQIRKHSGLPTFVNYILVYGIP